MNTDTDGVSTEVVDIPVDQSAASVDMLSMSDEDISNMTHFPEDLGSVVDTVDEPDKADEVIEAGAADDTGIDAGNADVFNSDVNQPAAVKDAQPADTVDKTVEVDYKAVYEQVFAPFKANGKDMKVTSVEDVVHLMQMGANYNKKMAALKPNLKIMKMLENNGLLDEAKLNFLIDLDKKSPDAITKLLKDSGIDPLDVDTREPAEYTPKAYNVTDAEVALEEVFAEIRDTASFKDTLDIVNNKWDSASRKVLLHNPENIKILNAHKESGLYDHVMGVVENERMLGRLTGMNDIDAYKHVGLQLEKSGAFKAPGKTPSNAGNKPPVIDSRAAAERQKEQDRLNKKRSASSPAGSVTSKTPDDGFNPLSLSDAEFEKYAAKRGLTT